MSAAQSNQPESRKAPVHRPSTTRLAELVQHLTDCSPELAQAAVEAVKSSEPEDSTAALELVARAMSAIRRSARRPRPPRRSDEAHADHLIVTRR